MKARILLCHINALPLPAYTWNYDKSCRIWVIRKV